MYRNKDFWWQRVWLQPPEHPLAAPPRRDGPGTLGVAREGPPRLLRHNPAPAAERAGAGSPPRPQEQAVDRG